MKRFSKSLFKKWDSKAREVAIRYLWQSGYMAESNQRVYDPDIIVLLDSGEEVYAEVEVKTKWAGPTFPYPTVHLPMRKMKYVEPFSPTFFVFNNTLDHAMAVKSADLREHMGVDYKSNSYVTGEAFMDIDVKWCILLDMEVPYEGELF